MIFINRQERLNIREATSIAKMLGTVVCVGGAITMAFFKGSKLLNHSLNNFFILLHSLSSRWAMGALLLVGSSSCWSLWLIMQVNFLEKLFVHNIYHPLPTVYIFLKMQKRGHLLRYLKIYHPFHHFLIKSSN